MSTYSLTLNEYSDKVDGVDLYLASHMNAVQDELALIEDYLTGGSAGNLEVDGTITATLGLIATAGGLTVTAGGATITAGNVEIDSGTLNVSGLITAEAGLTVSANDLLVSAGTITASGLISSSGGGLQANTTVVAGTGITATTGNIAASSGNVSASGTVAAGTTVTGGTGLIATTGGLTVSAGGADITGNVSIDGYVGFYDTTPVAQPAINTTALTSITHTAPGTPDYALQDLTDSGGFGFATKDEGNTVLSVILNLQTRVTELETKLKALGLMASS
jgi:hypothetical protein